MKNDKTRGRVLKFLEEKGEPFTTWQIASRLSLNKETVRNVLLSLRRDGHIQRERSELDGRNFVYWFGAS